MAIAGWDQNGHGRELQHLATRLRIVDSVHFLGPVFGPEKEELFAQAAAFVLPSFSEGLPMAVLEAWAHRLPVLMTRYCNLPEGFQADAAIEIDTSPDGIREGLEALAAISDERRLKGVQLCNRLYSQRRVSDSLKAVYSWLLRLGPRPTCLVTD